MVDDLPGSIVQNDFHFLVLSQVLIYLESQSQRILDGDPPSLVLSAFQSCKP